MGNTFQFHFVLKKVSHVKFLVNFSVSGKFTSISGPFQNHFNPVLGSILRSLQIHFGSIFGSVLSLIRSEFKIHFSFISGPSLIPFRSFWGLFSLICSQFQDNLCSYQTHMQKSRFFKDKFRYTITIKSLRGFLWMAGTVAPPAG